MKSATRCRQQPLCWKNTSHCDLAELGRPDQTESCSRVASYCDMRTGMCRATRIAYPKPNPCVNWRTMRSNPACAESKYASYRACGRARRAGLIVCIVVAVLVVLVGMAAYSTLDHPWPRVFTQLPEDESSKKRFPRCDASNSQRLG